MTEFLSITDYLAQAILRPVIFVYPWRIRPNQSWRAFSIPFAFAFLWRLWRMAIFDPATHNDIPGIAYIFAAVILALVANFTFLLRCWLVGRKNKSP